MSESRFEAVRPLSGKISDAAYFAMEKIPNAQNVRVLEVGPNDEWVRVGYDWVSKETHYDATDALNEHGLVVVKKGQNSASDPLGQDIPDINID